MILIADLIAEDFGYTSRGRWGRAKAHDSLVVDEQKQLFFWNSEQLFGNARDYLIKVRKMSTVSADALLRNLGHDDKIYYGSEKKATEYRVYEGLVESFYKAGKDNRGYWYQRCLNDNTIDKFQLGFYQGWYTIPLFEDSRFVNFQIRRDKPTKQIRYWYSNTHPMLMNDTVLDFVETVYMTEGTVDSLLLLQNGIPAIATTGGTSYFNPAWLHKFMGVKTIYYIADNDSAGIKASRMFSKVLGEMRVRIFRFSEKRNKYDTVNFFQDGGTADEFRELVETRAKCSFQLGRTR